MIAKILDRELWGTSASLCDAGAKNETNPRQHDEVCPAMDVQGE